MRQQSKLLRIVSKMESNDLRLFKAKTWTGLELRMDCKWTAGGNYPAFKGLKRA